MRYPLLILMGVAFGLPAQCHAQTLPFDDSVTDFDDFVKNITTDFEDFRQQTMFEFTEFLRNPWKEFKDNPPVPKPVEPPVPPVVLPDEDIKSPIEDNPVVFEDLVEPVTVTPPPSPIAPIEEVPTVEPNYVDFTFFGTMAKVRYSNPELPNLTTINENNVADALNILADSDNDNTIVDCLKLRSDLQLCDWAYLKMLEALSKEATSDENQAALLLSYLMIQSGYKIRLGTDSIKLYMLFASDYIIYDLRGFYVGGKNYYTLDSHPTSLQISEAAFPKEQSLSLAVSSSPKLDMSESKVISRRSTRFPAVQASTSVNMNLLDFYTSYPTSTLNDNFVVRWALYANTPMSPLVKSKLYPSLKESIKDKNNYEAVNMLLNYLQTGFEYEYDDKVWGHDRAFFAEESLYYPYCDCEDRSILLTRIVRDLLGLDCALVYYPGHLATAIALGEDARGDFISIDGKKYIICDPTYINAPIGMTMPGMDNTSVKVIVF